jgi:hypothetical protein
VRVSNVTTCCERLGGAGGSLSGELRAIAWKAIVAPRQADRPHLRGPTPLAATSPICLNPARMSREAHSATTYPSSAALSGFGFAYRYAWRFS